MTVPEQPVTQWRHRVFVGYVVAMIVVFLLPAPSTPLAESKHVDKLVHFGIFLGFTILLYGDRHWRAWGSFGLQWPSQLR
jgi:hypothetical protein